MTNEEAREFVDRWKRTGPAMEKVRRQELRNARHENDAYLIDQLLEAGLQHARTATTSGLIEMQRIFAKGRS